LVEQSQLLRVQQVRIFLTHLRGRAALAAGGEGRLREVERDARLLQRERVGWALALARLLAAGAAARPGETARSRDLLREAVDLCAGFHMHRYAASARLLLGRSLGGEGRALAEEAEAWMKGQKVVRPDRLAALLAPGLL